jgi:hypothetical protein
VSRSGGSETEKERIRNQFGQFLTTIFLKRKVSKTRPFKKERKMKLETNEKEEITAKEISISW